MFSLFTKNYTVVVDYFKTHKQPPNLSLVISSLLLDEPFGLEFLPEYLTNVKIFTVYLIIVFRLVSFPFYTELTQLRRKPYTGNR